MIDVTSYSIYLGGGYNYDSTCIQPHFDHLRYDRMPVCVWLLTAA